MGGLRASAGGDRAARAVLMNVAEPAERALGTAVEHHGAPEVLARLRTGSIAVPGAAGMRIRLAGIDAAEELRAGARVGARLVVPGDPEWPPALEDLGALRPLGLWCRGPLGLVEATENALAVVGARAATSYGCHVAGSLGAELAERGWTVLSGAAFGIDAAAHRGALAARGMTVAVLAGGIDVPYPVAHTALIGRIAQDGLVLSEAGLGAAPARRRFLTRNRLIAALSAGTVVVEAAARSGAATTARWAVELDRVLMAVPGPITSAVSAGCHDLMRHGQAVVVTRAAEVVEAVGRLGTDLAPPRPREVRERDRLDPALRSLLEVFPARGALGSEALARECGIDAGGVLAALGELAVLGMVERVDGGWRLTGAARAGGPARPRSTVS